MKKNFGLTYKQDKPDSFQIKIKQLVNIVGNNSNVAGKNIDVVNESKQMSYLLDRVMKVESEFLNKDREIEKLKDEIKLLKKKN